MPPQKQGTLNVGVLFSRSGVTSKIEATLVNAAELAVHQINRAGGVIGRKIEICYRDPQSSPKRYAELARQMTNDGGLRFLFGCYTSACRKAVLPHVEQANGILFFPTFYEGFEFSNHCVYSGCVPNQFVVRLIRYMMEHYGKRFYLVGSNYVFPYETNRIIRDYVSKHGAEVINERYIPLEATKDDIDRVIAEIKDDPDAITISTVVGKAITPFYQRYREAGIDISKRPIASLVTAEADVQTMGNSIAAGHISSASYFQSIVSPENQNFLADYQTRFGSSAAVSSTTEAVFNQVHLFANAVERAGSDAADAVRAALANHQYLAPQGAISIDEQTHHTRVWPRIARVNDAGNFEILVESTAPVEPDPYMIFPQDDAWDGQSRDKSVES